MENPDSLPSEKLPKNEGAVESTADDASLEIQEENQFEREIREVQAELEEGVGELNQHLDELEELQNDESLPARAKKVLSAGWREIKNYIQANPTVNALAGIHMAGVIGSQARDLFEGKDIKEVAGNVLGKVVFWGIAKAIAYVGWGKKAQEKARVEKEWDEAQLQGPPMPEMESLEDATEPSIGDEADEVNIKRLKDELHEKYNDTVE